MPSLLAHCFCGDAVVNNTDSIYLHNIINNNKNIYYLGCQGPDMFLYYHRIPVLQNQKNAKEYRGFSGLMHSHHVNQSFEVMLQAAKKGNDVLKAYVAGFICHNCLDSKAHPMIFYNTGSLQKNIGYSHQLYEGQIDLGMLEKYKLAKDEYDVSKMLKIKNKDKTPVIEILNEVFQKVYHKDDITSIAKDALRDFIRISNILNDPYDKKIKLITKLEERVNNPGLGTSMMTPLSYDNHLDAMNYRKETWYHPVTKEPSNKSFEELFTEAKEKGVKIFAILDKYFHDEVTIYHVLDEIGNSSYETGLNKYQENHYFKKDM